MLFAQWNSIPFSIDETGATVECVAPAGTATILLAMYDVNGQMLGTVAGSKVDTSHWRFDSRLVNTATSMKVMALDSEGRPLMSPVIYPSVS